MTRHTANMTRIDVLRVLTLCCALLALEGSNAAQPEALKPPAATIAESRESEESRMWMTVGERRFSITLSDTEAARSFVTLLPLTIEMPDLNSNEKHAELPRSLPTSTYRPGTIRNGDLMLYGSRTLVLFYLTFDSTYSYTRIGRVDNPDDLARTLGSGGARITFSKN